MQLLNNYTHSFRASRLHTHHMLTGEKWHSISASIDIFWLGLTVNEFIRSNKHLRFVKTLN